MGEHSCYRCVPEDELMTEFLVVQTLNGLAYSMLLFIMALGLSLIFGLMGFVNLAHGSFFLLGAYMALTTLRLTGNFWFALFASSLMVGVIGIILEKIWLSRFYRRSEMDQVILTFGFALLFVDIAKFFWGVDVLALNIPPVLTGSIHIGDTEFPYYRLFVSGVGIALFLLTSIFIERTKLGALIRAAVWDQDMVMGLGLNVRTIFAVMFALGVFLAGFGGVLAAPITGISAGLDFEILIVTLIVVVVGGLGNINGAFWASLLIGIIETFGRALFPSFAIFLIFTLMAVVLVIRSLRKAGLETEEQSHYDSSPVRKTRRSHKKVYAYLGILTLFLVLPYIGIESYQLSLWTEILIFSIMAVGLDLLVGYTGLVSLGHAGFFAVAAYAAALTARSISPEIGIVLVVSILTTALFAIGIGWLSLRMAGFYFLMVTFAFAQIIHSAADRWYFLTGGTDGISVPHLELFGNTILTSPVSLYFAALGTLVITWLILRRIVASPFGQALVGIRENTSRMNTIGYKVRLYKLAAFTLSALFAGLAGLLNVQFNLFVSPEDAHWLLSAIILVMVLIGGAGTLNGPILGTALYMYFQNWLSSYTEYWSFVIGVLFVALVSGARRGILGLVSDLCSKVWEGFKWKKASSFFQSKKSPNALEDFSHSKM